MTIRARGPRAAGGKAALALGAPLLAASCSGLLGLDELTFEEGAGGAPTTTTSASDTSISATSTASKGGGGSGAGGASSSGGSGGGSCEPGAACYDGPEGTRGVGACKAGALTCSADGEPSGCEGEVHPAAERCEDPAADENCDGTPGCAFKARWAKAFGGIGIEIVVSVAVGPDGAVGVMGGFTDELRLPGQAEPIPSGGVQSTFVAVFEEDGALRFAHVYPTNYFPAQGQVAFDPQGNLAAVGGFVGTVDFGGGPRTSEGDPTVSNADAFVLRLGPGGDHLASRRFGDGFNQVLSSVAIQPSGDLVVAGYAAGTISFGQAPLVTGSGTQHDAVLARLKPDLEEVWSARFGAKGTTEIAFGVDVDVAGRIFVAGTCTGPIDFGQGSRPCEPSGDAFLAAFSAEGGPLWDHVPQHPFLQRPNALAASADGRVAIGGSFEGELDLSGGEKPPLSAPEGGADAFLAAFDAKTGALLSQHELGDDAGVEVVQGLAFDAAGNLVVGGAFRGGSLQIGNAPLSNPASTNDIFVAKLDPTGAGIWAKAIGDGADQNLQAILGRPVAVHPLGYIAVGGFFSGTVNLGTGPLNSSEGPVNFDGLVALLYP